MFTFILIFAHKLLKNVFIKVQEQKKKKKKKNRFLKFGMKKKFMQDLGTKTIFFSIFKKLE